VILTDHKHSAKTGKFKEILGTYNLKKNEVVFKADRIAYWIKVGAQVSDTVHNFLVHQKLIGGKKKNVLSKKSPTKPKKEFKKA
jgi:ribosomal protein S16